jgi:hypothetical protein
MNNAKNNNNNNNNNKAIIRAGWAALAAKNIFNWQAYALQPVTNLAIAGGLRDDLRSMVKLNEIGEYSSILNYDSPTTRITITITTTTTTTTSKR